MEKAAPSKKAKQKRNRIITACFDCRERKAGCDRKKPVCSRCRDGRTCLYLDPPHNALVNGVSRELASLPLDLREKVTRLYSQCLGDPKEEAEDSDYERLEVSPLVTESASYDDDLDETKATDLGFRIGKLHLTDRVGGQYRPGMAQEFKMLLQATGHQREWAEEQNEWPTPPGIFEAGMISPTFSFLQPSTSYLAPNLNLLSLGAAHDLLSYLPPRPISIRILQQYWTSVHPVARILHRPSFEKRWQIFSDHMKSKTPPVKSLQALVFSILFSGIIAMPSGTLDQEFGEDQHLWLANLKVGTELALMEAQMLQTAKVETLQAFVAYLVVLCRDEVSRVHSSLVAAAIRIAECNGLHCDGDERGYNPIETHVRRLIWFNLCFLDIRLAEAQGPRPIISVDNYTTKFPANVDDAAIRLDGCTEPGNDRWTEMTVSLIRFRCNEFIRSIWVSRRRVMARETSITPVMHGIESFRVEWSLKYTPDQPDDPLQRYGRCILEVQTARIYAMVLQLYHIHPRLRMPNRLLSVLIENGIKTMDRVIELETLEDFAPWRWYAGALQQHHYALLMAVEIIMNPRRKESSRIWRGLDYVFEPPNLPPVAKARWIISQAWCRMEIYLQKRSLRAPIDLEQSLREALKLSSQETQRAGSESTASPGTRRSFDEGSPEPDENPIQRRKSHIALDKTQRSSSRHVTEHSKQRQGTEFAHHDRLVPGIQSSREGQNSPLTATASKQLVDVDWGVLNAYYPPEHFNGELDVDFETWSQQMQSNPYPYGNAPPDRMLKAFDGQTFDYTDDISPHLTEQAGIWPETWPQSSFPSQTPSNSYGSMQRQLQSHGPHLDPSLPVSTASAHNFGFPVQPIQAPYGHSAFPQNLGVPHSHQSQSAVNHRQQAETAQKRKENSELNFGMGVYQMPPRST